LLKLKNFLLRILSAMLVLGSLYVGYASLHGKTTPPAVRTAALDKGTISSYIRATATVSSLHDVSLSGPAGARVQEMRVKVGDAVKKGQVLMLLDSTDASLQLAADDAAVAELDAGIEHKSRAVETLRKDYLAGAEPREKLTQAEEALALERIRRRHAAATAHQTRQRINDATITAPIDGVVTEIQIRPGEMVSAATPLLKLADPRSQEILARMEQSDAQLIRPGMAVRVFQDSAPDQVVDEKVVRIDPAVHVEGNASHLAVWISLTPSKLNLRPNQQVDVHVLAGTRDAVTRLPLEALITTKGASSVWVIDDGHLVSRPISIGMVGDRYAEVLAGLSPDQTVVIPDGKTLKEGDSVTIDTRGDKGK
jgi:RND family efflux transporter MFP subunit